MSRKTEYYKYLKSPEWKALREKALEYADYRCQLCNTVKKLNVHHRCYPKVYGEEKVNDLTVLCDGCHVGFHTGFNLKNNQSKAKSPMLKTRAQQERKAEKKRLKKAKHGALMEKQKKPEPKPFEPKHVLFKGGR